LDTRFIDRHRKRIEQLLKNVPTDPSGNLEFQSHWARYTCVVMYGYIEDSVQAILRSYCCVRCSSNVQNFVSGQLEFFQSAKAENILALLNKFDPRWEVSLSGFLDDERRSAINSVVGNRHRIAHGKDVSLTIHQLASWYPKINEVIDHIVGLCRAP
jgi:hypothetical protein